MKVLVVGSGGREHALAWKISQSPLIKTLIMAPGNPGTAPLGVSIDIKADQKSELVDFAIRESVDLVVVGPEIPLSLGIADALREKNIPCFGPEKSAAQLETSKAFTKAFCRKYQIPTARSITVNTISKAKSALRQFEKPYVLKADGLAAGKGVVICKTLQEAEEQAASFLKGAFGQAGKILVIEEFLKGEEVSFFALCDGKTALPFETAQDHKRAYDGDEGPNTGGMGAYSPVPNLSQEEKNQVMEDIIKPTLKGMLEENTPYQGVLYAGLMMTDSGPKLIEYNVRFGDPECQVLMMRLRSDLLPFLYACANGTLSELKEELIWFEESVVVIVLASKGYPGSYRKNMVLPYLDKAKRMSDVYVYHAGTGYSEDHKLIAIGGRVLNIASKAESLSVAVERAYQALESINWEEGFYRHDIAFRALNHINEKNNI